MRIFVAALHKALQDFFFKKSGFSLVLQDWRRLLCLEARAALHTLCTSVPPLKKGKQQTRIRFKEGNTKDQRISV